MDLCLSILEVCNKHLFLGYVKNTNTLLQSSPAPTSHYIYTTVVPFILSMGTSKIIKVQVLDYQAIWSTPFIIWRFRLIYRHLLPNVVHPKVPLRYAGFTLVISSNMTFYLCDKWLNYSRSRLRTESNKERV